MPSEIDNHNNKQMDVYVLSFIDACFIIINSHTHTHERRMKIVDRHAKLQYQSKTKKNKRKL